MSAPESTGKLKTATVRVVPTSDGSNTMLHTGLNQTYHSLYGAEQEAKHVFLQNGLTRFLEQNGTAAASILEIGFGTGLNFLVSADHCLLNSISLTYTGIEPFPLPREILKESGYHEFLSGKKSWEDFLAWYPGEEPLRIGNSITLQLIQKPILETPVLPPADIIYFDAFAPGTQPEMWTKEVITHSVSPLKAGGIFVSYSITGNLKRILKSLDFQIEKPKGAAGKREMIRAVKQ